MKKKLVIRKVHLCDDESSLDENTTEDDEEEDDAEESDEEEDTDETESVVSIETPRKRLRTSSHAPGGLLRQIHRLRDEIRNNKVTLQALEELRKRCRKEVRESDMRASNEGRNRRQTK